MKRVVAAFALLAVAVSVAVWSGYIFNREMSFFETELYKLILISENSSDEELTEETEKIILNWNSTLGILRSVVLHEGIDELNRNISSLSQIIKYLDREQMKEKCIEAINQIASLKSCEKISFENIL
ncbi:MAG: DUF4363 family protein [Ruminococcaceae bacterium]|nr:DUF4363 family protein [Oscillospiraceae bacterium]